MKALLYDHLVAKRELLLRSFLRTDWTVIAVASVDDRAAVQRAVADADAFIGIEFPEDLAEAADRLRLIHCVGAGVDGFDLAIVPSGCVLCNVYEHEIPMAEYIMLCVLTFATQARQYEASFRAGRWEGSGRAEGTFHGEVLGKTLGLIGYGHIGRALAVRARAFGMRVMAVGQASRSDPDLDWYGTADELHHLLAEADFVAVVCPLTDKTRGMLGAAELHRMKPSAYLINVARAEIVQEELLFITLRERRIAGAALDVWYQYPESPDSVIHGSRFPFHELDDVIVTPHFSAWTESMIQRRYRRIAENLDRLSRGEPLERVVYRAKSCSLAADGQSA